MSHAFSAPSLAHLSFQPVSGREPVVFTNADRLIAYRDALLRITQPVPANNVFVFKGHRR